MPKMTAADRKAKTDLRAVLATMPVRSLHRTPRVKKFKQPRDRTYNKRLADLKRARAIIAFATLSTWRNKFGYYDAPDYYKIATTLGLTRKDADLADELWNDVNGADEGPETEELAMERVNDLITLEKDS